MKKLTIILGSIFILFSTSLQAQVFQEWVRTYSGPDSLANLATAVDVNGNVYVTGESGSIAGKLDYATIKYNKAGVQQWVATFNGADNSFDRTKAMVIDKNCNVYVTGSSFGIATEDDYATIKYDSNGVQQWIAFFHGGGSAGDIPSDIAIDASGNIYVTGTTKRGGSGFDYTTLKYNNNGVQQWVATYNSPGNGSDQATAIGVDNNGNVYVTGSSGVGITSDYATIKYSPNGVQQWVARYNGPGNSVDQAKDLVLDNKANIYVTGISFGIGTGADFATIKYNTAGVIQWIQRYNGPLGGDAANSIALDNADNVFVTGASAGIESTADYATIKYDKNGTFQWVARFDGGANSKDQPNDIETDKDGNVYVTGVASTSPVNIDYATIKYDKKGVEQWRQIFDGVNHGTTFQDIDWANDLSVDNDGNVYVTGYSWKGSFFDYATVKYSQSFIISDFSQDDLAPSYAELIGVEHLYSIVNAHASTDVMNSVSAMLKSQIRPKNPSVLDETPVIISIYSTNQIAGKNKIDLNEINGFSMLLRDNIRLEHVFYKRISSSNSRGNTVFKEDKSLRANVSGFTSEIGKALQYSFYDFDKLPLSSTTYLFRSNTLDFDTTINVDETELMSRIASDHQKQGGIQTIGFYSDRIYNQLQIPNQGGSAVYPADCRGGGPNCDRDGVNCYLADGGGCAVSAIDEVATALNVNLPMSTFQYQAMFDFRNDFLNNFSRGKDYIGYYYTIGGYIYYQERLNLSTLMLYTSVMPEIYQAMRALSSADSTNAVIITESLCTKSLNIISHLRTISSASTLHNALDMIEIDLNNFVGKKQEAVLREVRAKRQLKTK